MKLQRYLLPHIYAINSTSTTVAAAAVIAVPIFTLL